MILPYKLLRRVVMILLFMTLFFAGLYFAGTFLKPIAVAILIVSLMLPLARWMESRNVNRFLSSAACTLILVGFLAGIGGLVAYQGKQFGKQYDELKSQASETVDKATSSMAETFGLTQKELVDKFKSGGLSSMRKTLKKTADGVISSMTSLLLIIVYVFGFLYYRSHFKKFLIRMFARSNKVKVKRVTEESLNKALQYLQGKMILIGILAVTYTVGLSLIGVKFSVFYGIFAALLTLIPYIGNIIGGGLPLLTAILSGDTQAAILVVALFSLVQLIESYVLTPLIVGKEADLHPILTILVVVLGGAIWGVVGMIIAIPFLGMAMVILSYIPNMEPYAFLLRDE